jgi:hypothetical protein
LDKLSLPEQHLLRGQTQYFLAQADEYFLQLMFTLKPQTRVDPVDFSCFLTERA